MDKYEYKVRADEIKELIATGDYAEAADIADTIDWRRVKSVMMLCTISDLYKINRRYEDAKNMLLLAYERRPGGKTICYSLCELCIKTEEYVQAINYYKEFVQVAPKDPGRYILQYKLYEAQDVGLEERIGVLEELKKRDYREKWAYELAYLYHRVGLATRCVEECDELILWFGEGKYVIKAMELKMLHEPLTESQQEKYNRRFQKPATEKPEAVPEVVSEQEALREVWEGVWQTREPEGARTVYPDPEQPPVRSSLQEEEADGMDIRVKTMDVGRFNTINLQAELAEGLKEVLAEEQKNVRAEEITRSILSPMMDSDTESLTPPEIDEVSAGDFGPEAEVMESSEVFFGATSELGSTQLRSEGEDAMREIFSQEERTGQDTGEKSAEAEDNAAESVPEQKADETAETVMEELRRESVVTAEEQVLKAEPPKELAGVLAQESDGQISLVMPESDAIEKQITGQMSIEDILSEWEKRKKENEAKRQEEVRKHVLEQTGTMFTEFEAAVRDGILAQLEMQTTGEDVSEDELPAEDEEAESAAESFGEPADEGEEASGDIAEEAEVSGGIAEDGASVESAETEAPEAEAGSEESAADEEAGWAEPEEVADGEEAENASEAESGSEESAADEEAETAEPEKVADGEEPENASEAESGSEEGAADEEAETAEPEEDADGEEPENASEAESGSEEGVADEEAGWAELEEVADGEEAENASEAESGSEESAADEEAETAEPEENADGEETENASEAESGSEESAADEEVEMAEPEENADGEEAEIAEQESTAADAEPVEREQPKVRALTREEKELYAPFIQSRSGKEKLVKAVDSISLAAYTGNIIITGEEGMDMLSLAKNMIREVQMTDSNFSGRVAKISGKGMNTRNIEETLENLKNGALIISKASEMERPAAETLRRILQKENFGIIIAMEDTKKAMRKLLKKNPGLQESFTARLDVEAMSNDSLAAFGRQYARKQEYSIDELGMLALHTRIEERQTIDHVVTVLDVREIVDNAIRHANRKNLGHFFDILFARRYDDEDMIILTEKDFV